MTLQAPGYVRPRVKVKRTRSACNKATYLLHLKNTKPATKRRDCERIDGPTEEEAPLDPAPCRPPPRLAQLRLRLRAFPPNEADFVTEMAGPVPQHDRSAAHDDDQERRRNVGRLENRQRVREIPFSQHRREHRRHRASPASKTCRKRGRLRRKRTKEGIGSRFAISRSDNFDSCLASKSSRHPRDDGNAAGELLLSISYSRCRMGEIPRISAVRE